MLNSPATRNAGFGFFILLLILSSIHCAEKEPKKENLLLGSWHVKRKNIYEIFTFKTSGSFVAQLRVEGRFSKIIEKKESIDGTYLVEDKKLTIIPNGKLSSGNLKDGIQKVYEIVSVNKDILSLGDKSGNIRDWDRVRGQQNEKEEITTDSLVGLGPIVVNLAKKRDNQKDRYLCIDLDFVLSVKQKENQVIALHPRVREVCIFFLSSLSYSDVNSLNKITNIRDELLGLTRPYVKYAIKELQIKNVIVTASSKVVDEFLGTPIDFEGIEPETGTEGSPTDAPPKTDENAPSAKQPNNA